MQSNNRKRNWDRSDARRRKKKRKRRVKVNKGGRLQVYGRAVNQLRADISSVYRYLNTELHYHDVSASAVSLSTTPSMALFNGIQLGDTATTRTGQSIKMDRGDLRFTLEGDNTAVRQFVRIIVVVDKQCNGAAMSAGDLLNNTTSPLNIVTPYTDGSQMRFIILFDETFALSTTGQGVITKVVGIPANQHVMYNINNVGDVTDIITNSIYMLYFSDQSVNQPLLNYYWRLWYVDN